EKSQCGPLSLSRRSQRPELTTWWPRRNRSSEVFLALPEDARSDQGTATRRDRDSGRFFRVTPCSESSSAGRRRRPRVSATPHAPSPTGRQGPSRRAQWPGPCPLASGRDAAAPTDDPPCSFLQGECRQPGQPPASRAPAGGDEHVPYGG